MLTRCPPERTAEHRRGVAVHQSAEGIGQRRIGRAVDLGLQVRRYSEHGWPDRQVPGREIDGVVAACRKRALVDRIGAAEHRLARNAGQRAGDHRSGIAVHQTAIGIGQRGIDGAIDLRFVGGHDLQRRRRDREVRTREGQRVVAGCRQCVLTDRIAADILACNAAQGAAEHHRRGVAVGQTAVAVGQHRLARAVDLGQRVRRDSKGRLVDGQRARGIADGVIAGGRAACRDRAGVGSGIGRRRRGGRHRRKGRQAGRRVAVDEAGIRHRQRRHRAAIGHRLVVGRDEQRRLVDGQRARGIADRVVGIDRTAGRQRAGIGSRVGIRRRTRGHRRQNRQIRRRVAVDEAGIADRKRRHRAAIGHRLVAGRDQQRRRRDREICAGVGDDVVAARLQRALADRVNADI